MSIERSYGIAKRYQMNKICMSLLGCLAGLSQTSQAQHPHLEIVGEARAKQVFVIRIVGAEKPIAFCERLNVAIPTDSGLEDAPRPVQVEKWDEHRHKWFLDTSNLPDLAVAFSSVSILPGTHKDFLLRVESSGNYRFILRYVEGEQQQPCPELRGHKHKIESSIMLAKSSWEMPIPVEVWCGGDDGLTLTLRDAMENAFKSSPDFQLNSGKKPGTLVVTIPSNVKWKQIGGRTQILYSVEFTSIQDQKLGSSTGSCWDDKVASCALKILKDAKMPSAKIR